MNRIVSMMAFLFVMAALVAGQDAPKVINGGILNGKAIKLPKPAYPAEAKAARAGGTVRIKVTIDEDGNVTSAELANEPYEVDYLAKKHALPAPLVKKVIQQEGPTRTKVEKYLSNMKKNGR